MVIGVHIHIQFWAYMGVVLVGEGPWRHIGAPRAFRGLFVGVKGCSVGGSRRESLREQR